MVITTINQTTLSYAAAIVGAEYILRLVTPGTHDWNKFVTVEELSDLISESMLLCTVTYEGGGVVCRQGVI